MSNQLIDHLFRHQYGKMVSILTKIFGFEHLTLIEDAVQDTFIKATLSWRNGPPENPEAWLTAAAKNRVIDLFRSINARKARVLKTAPISSLQLDELFLDHEIEDSQLRMIFTACHPKLAPEEQIAFSLRTISGFSIKEIAAALLTKSETIKKRLQRARKMITRENIKFEIPRGKELPLRIDRVLEVLYVLFNEGFHSNKKDLIIRKDLCGEALRLNKMMLKKEDLRTDKTYALFALMCFHSARLDSKVNEHNELINLSEQDRTKWYFPLVMVGSDAMNNAVQMTDTFSSYHYEAAIASEHLRAPTFEATNWASILKWYKELYHLQPSDLTKLNMAVVCLQLMDLQEADQHLKEVNPKELLHIEYLYRATLAEFFYRSKDFERAATEIISAIEKAPNESEKKFLSKKQELYLRKLNAL